MVVLTSRPPALTELQLSPYALMVLYQLQQAGHQAFLVGGAVRDLLLQAPTTDYDFTTNATPEQILALFPESYYENQFGTVSLTPRHLAELLTQTWSVATSALPAFPQPVSAALRPKILDLAQATKIHISLQTSETPLPQSGTKLELDQDPRFQGKGVEITTFRSDGVYSDFRRPDGVTWGSSLNEDLARRDFTINALAIEVELEVLTKIFQQLATEPTWPSTITLLPTEFKVVDEHQGLQDLSAYTIRTVGEPDRRFQEDALRMLRAVRLAVQLNFEIAEQTFAAIQSQAKLITHVSGERIKDELFKMLSSGYPAEAIELLDESGLLVHLLPELLEGKGVAQGGHHTTEVWTHSLDALRHCPSPDPLVRLATLLHDVGKPRTFARQNGTITFYNHEIVGAKMANHIGHRLKLSRRELDRLYILIRHHMFYYQPENTDSAIRRFMRKVGLGALDDILDLREGDRLGSGARRTSWRLEEMKQRMIEQINQPFDINDLAIDGHDLMATFSTLKPGPLLGQLLKYLFELVLEKPELNTQEQLLQLADQWLQENPLQAK